MVYEKYKQLNVPQNVYVIEQILENYLPKEKKFTGKLFCEIGSEMSQTVCDHVSYYVFALFLTMCRGGLSIRTCPFYSTVWMQLETSSQSNSCARSTIDLDMRSPTMNQKKMGGDLWVGIAWFLMIWAFGEQDNLVTARILYKFSFLICFSKWANFLWFGIYKLYIT